MYEGLEVGEPKSFLTAFSLIPSGLQFHYSALEPFNMAFAVVTEMIQNQSESKDASCTNVAAYLKNECSALLIQSQQQSKHPVPVHQLAKCSRSGMHSPTAFRSR